MFVSVYNSCQILTSNVMVLGGVSWEVIRSCRGALTNEISAYEPSCIMGKHSAAELLHGYTRGPLASSPDLYPWLLNLHPTTLCLLQRKVAYLTYPSQGTGLKGRPLPRQGPVWAGLSTHEPCTEALLQSTPALFLGRAGPEHLRAGYGLTKSCSWTGWVTSCLPVASRSFQALGLCLHMPPPPLPDSRVPP